MVKTMELRATTHEISVIWIKPEFLPSEYTVRAQCRYLCMNSMTYISPTRHLLATALLTTISARPYSVCDITLKAHYNPASIDNGITKSIATTMTSKMLSASVLCMTWYGLFECAYFITDCGVIIY